MPCVLEGNLDDDGTGEVEKRPEDFVVADAVLPDSCGIVEAAEEEAVADAVLPASCGVVEAAEEEEGEVVVVVAVVVTAVVTDEDD